MGSASTSNTIISGWRSGGRDWRARSRLAQDKAKEAPALVPVFAHRFLPAEPLLEGNPVLSVWQADIIYYGLDLVNYFLNQFHLSQSSQANGSKPPRKIRFWSDIIEKAAAQFEHDHP